jgi:hypothetical protein
LCPYSDIGRLGWRETTNFATLDTNGIFDNQSAVAMALAFNTLEVLVLGMLTSSASRYLSRRPR